MHKVNFLGFAILLFGPFQELHSLPYSLHALPSLLHQESFELFPLHPFQLPTSQALLFLFWNIHLGLGYMLLEGAYIDAFILHERSLNDAQFPPNDNGDDSSFLHSQDIADPRKALHDTWLKHFRYQPLWKIRNYFGEKIALYFGWLGELIDHNAVCISHNNDFCPFISCKL